MFEENDENQGKTVKKDEKSPKSAPFNWKSLSIDLLIQYRDEITQCLPPIALSELDLEEEVLLQYHTLRALQSTTLNDDDFPLNQRAQVAATINNTLTKLVDMQEKVYSQERFKKIENLLIKCLTKLPEEVSAEFIEKYEKIITSE